ncbi:MAG: hypothetical protein AMXMBFR58_16520 [Phycisphaerae bacterium]
MIRREFIAAATTAVAASVSVAAGRRPEDSGQPAGGGPAKGPFKLDYAPHFGMFRHHAADDLDQISFAADQGFRSWEDNGMKGRGKEFQEKFAQRMAKHNMRMGIFVSTWIDWEHPMLSDGDQGRRERFVKEMGEAVEVCKRINATWMTTPVGRVSQHLPWGHQFTNIVETLRQAAAVCEPAGKVMVLEPLNWRDHPGQFTATSDTIRALVKAVNSPACKILQDLYHLQVTEGNLIDNMNRSWDDIAYFQLGDNPGRMEPGTGEVNHRNVFKHIYQRGYKGILGMEHGMSGQGKEGEMALIKAYRDADSF